MTKAHVALTSAEEVLKSPKVTSARLRSAARKARVQAVPTESLLASRVRGGGELPSVTIQRRPKRDSQLTDVLHFVLFEMDSARFQDLSEYMREGLSFTRDDNADYAVPPVITLIN